MKARHHIVPGRRSRERLGDTAPASADPVDPPTRGVAPEPAAPARALGPYRIVRELGRGGTGIVYEAIDSKDGGRVALKTIDASVPDAVYRLKREFRALADVQHPNLVRFSELACHQGEWFFTMELVQGVDFIEHVRPERGVPTESGVITAAPTAREDTLIEALLASSPTAPSSPARVTTHPRFHEARLRSALLQLASALSAVHAAGHVHRDIKPSNVLVTEEGRVVVLDFGLVAASAGRGAAFPGPYVFGTPAYMAPEQIEGGAVGPAADWYAVGEMLFAILTGVLPFDGSATNLYEAKLTLPAPRPRDFVSDLPLDLEALCADLLRTDPAERPAERDIRARLGFADSQRMPLEEPESEPPFVGRHQELSALSRALEEAAAGRGCKVVVEGEPGIGKTALVWRFLRDADALVLRGRCYEQEAVPFKGADSIIDELSEYLLSLPDVQVRALLAGAGIRYLASVFPVLGRVPAVASITSRLPPVADPASVRERAFTELEELSRRLTDGRALVLFLDDVQWADRDSIAILQRVLADESRPVLFVTTLRTGLALPLDTAAFLADAERIELDALSAGDSGELLDALLARVAHAKPALPKASVLREAAGHPLFLLELAYSSHSSDGHGRLEEVLWERVRERDPLEQRFLEAVAVGGAPIAYEVLARAAEIDPGVLHTRLGSLRAAQLIRVTPRGADRLVEPYHDRLRESILGHLRGEPGDSLAERHLRLGRALLESTPEEALDTNVFAIVQHLNAGRDLLAAPAERRRLAALDLLASRQAQRATAYDRARDYALAGLALLEKDPWIDTYELARDLHFEILSSSYYAGDVAAAKGWFEAAGARLREGTDRTTLHVTWISLETTSGQLVGALEAGRQRLAELGVDVPAQATPSMIEAKHAQVVAARRGRKVDELLELPAIREPRYEGVTRVLVAMIPAAFFLDAKLNAWIQIGLMEVALEHGVCEASPCGVSGYGGVLASLFGQAEEGAAFGRLALALNERFENAEFAARLSFMYGGWQAPWVGPFDAAKEALREAYARACRYGDMVYEGYSATVLSVITFCESAELAAVQETGEWARGVSLRRKDLDMAEAPAAHARYAAALRGATPSPRDLGTAESTDVEFRASLGPQTPTALFYYFFCNAELAYLFGDAERTSALLTQANELVQVIFGLPTTVELCLLECLWRARLHASADCARRAQLEAEVTERVARLHAWARGAAANFEPQAQIASAELARMQGKDEEAGAAHARALDAARASRSPKREALALELASRHAQRRGEPGAEALRSEAALAYRRWGANAKAEELARSC
ncbi:MAG TPA: AAA family ATPase [Polyangiaceae bacterium]